MNDAHFGTDFNNNGIEDSQDTFLDLDHNGIADNMMLFLT